MVEKEKDIVDAVPWLRDLAERGGKGVVNNIDARALGRIADEIERLREALEMIADRDTKRGGTTSEDAWELPGSMAKIARAALGHGQEKP